MKKVGNILLDILIVLVVLLALAMSVMVISSKASGVPNVLGYSPITVLTDSMEPTFSVGDLIIIKQVDVDNLKIGDVVTYKEIINNIEILNTHRIVEKYIDGKALVYITKGDNVPQKDIMPIYPTDIVGKWTGQTVPLIGKALNFIKTQTGIMLCFVIPLALLFLWQLYKFIMLLADNKKEKAVEAVTANLEEEKQKAIQEYIAQQKAQEEVEQKAKQDLPPPPQEDTGNPKAGQESAPANEPEETTAGENTDDVGQGLAPADETEETPGVGNDPCVVPEEISDEHITETEEPIDNVGQGLAPAEDDEEPAEEMDESETNPTTAAAVPLPLTREAKDEGSSVPVDIDETIDDEPDEKSPASPEKPADK